MTNLVFGYWELVMSRAFALWYQIWYLIFIYDVRKLNVHVLNCAWPSYRPEYSGSSPKHSRIYIKQKYFHCTVYFIHIFAWCQFITCLIPLAVVFTERINTGNWNDLGKWNTEAGFLVIQHELKHWYTNVCLPNLFWMILVSMNNSI